MKTVCTKANIIIIIKVQCWNVLEEHRQISWQPTKCTVSTQCTRLFWSNLQSPTTAYEWTKRSKFQSIRQSYSASTFSEITKPSSVVAMSPVGWVAVLSRKFSDWSSLLVQSWHASSMLGPSPPYSGGKTGGEKKSLKVSSKSAPCKWIYREDTGNII